MLQLLLVIKMGVAIDTLPPYHTRPQFGEFWHRVWHTQAKNQTDTIFNQEGNGFWNKGDTVVYHWWNTLDTITPKKPLIKGLVEWSYDGRNNPTPKKD